MSPKGSNPVAAQGEHGYAWYRELNGYHWFVLSVASMGWAFDTMAQQLFNLARKPAIRDLLGGNGARQYVGRGRGNPSRTDGAIGHDHERVAMDVRRGGATRATRAGGFQEAQGARAVAQGAGREEKARVLPRVVRGSAVAAQL